MQLWVGLGNPGAKYALQRHNVGFMAADLIVEVQDFSPWQKKFRSLIAAGISIAIVTVVVGVGSSLNTTFTSVSTALK